MPLNDIFYSSISILHPLELHGYVNVKKRKRKTKGKNMLVLVFKICPDANMASYLIFMYVTVINVILEIYITNNIKKSSNKFFGLFFWLMVYLEDPEHDA